MTLFTLPAMVDAPSLVSWNCNALGAANLASSRPFAQPKENAVADPTIYGTQISTFVRSVRIALEEKRQPYKIVDVNIMKGENKTPAHLARQPFGKVPAFEHDGTKVYETAAINRYVDEAFGGTKLTPGSLADRTRMNQAMAIMDSYGYPSMLTAVVMQRLVAPMVGGTADEGTIKAGLPTARTTLSELQRIKGNDPYLAGKEFSLADAHALPVVHYFVMTPEGKAMLAEFPSLSAWWANVSTRPSVAKTVPQLG
jgi:glutathione S-transferase